jgi:hypothetical protein
MFMFRKRVEKESVREKEKKEKKKLYIVVSIPRRASATPCKQGSKQGLQDHA